MITFLYFTQKSQTSYYNVASMVVKTLLMKNIISEHAESYLESICDLYYMYHMCFDHEKIIHQTHKAQRTHELLSLLDNFKDEKWYFD